MVLLPSFQNNLIYRKTLDSSAIINGRWYKQLGQVSDFIFLDRFFSVLIYTIFLIAYFLLIKVIDLPNLSYLANNLATNPPHRLDYKCLLPE